MSSNLNFYIDGAWVAPLGEVKTIAVKNPATNQEIAEVALASAEDVDRAVQAAKKAFETYSQTTVEERLALLEAFLGEYKARFKAIGQAIQDEIGAPASLAQGAQAGSGMIHIKTAMKMLNLVKFEEELGESRITREPIGVVGMICPWNWPANQVMAKVAPALAAGCTMVLKPSEVSPLDAIIIAEAIDAAGYPAGVFNLVNGDGATTGAAITEHPNVDMVSFTGSTRAGVHISRAAAATIKRVSLELGGKGPNIVLDDADFERAVKGCVRGCLENTGQSCLAPTRLLVQKGRVGEAIEIAIATAEKVKVGDPNDPDVRMGPAASEMQYNKIQEMIELGIKEGARLVYGGPGKPEGLENGWYVKPTIFADVSNDMTIAREEIFGPVLCIIGYEDEDDAVRIANDSPYGLAGYVSSADVERARAVGKRMQVGAVQINGAGIDFRMPFGGFKQSGNGREWGLHGIEEFLEVKSLVV